MFGEKDLSGDLPCDGENSVSSKFSRQNHKVLEQSIGNPDEKMNLSQKGLDFFKESSMNLDGFPSKPSKSAHNSGCQELTLRYLCENSKLVCSQKGKEVAFMDSSSQDEKWVERDFLNLNESGVNSSSPKRQAEEEVEEFQGENVATNREKRPKLETLNLSLSLPDVSLSLTASNALQNNVERPMPTRSIQSLAPSRDNTCSNDFTAASLSYSYSHPFSHNPSCSLTHNSTEYYEYSVGRDDQIWCGGEGTNGSVHSRFRPIGDGSVALNNHGGGGGGGGGFSLIQGSRVMNKDSCNNSLYKTTSSDNLSFFPSELPARPRVETNSGDSRKKDSENLRGLESMDGGRARKLSRPERILREIVSEAIPIMAQIIQELSDETLESVKEYLKNLFLMSEKREELMALKKRLERRSDLSKETLSKCHKDQLAILVAVKMGLGSFLSAKIQLPVNKLVEIFLYMRCRNVNCQSILPVDDCDCKICSTNKGFCSSCMCPVCLNFDCANNTCSWVGCDVCSHWCHAACGIQRNLIKPGPSLKGPSGTSEMQFHCIGCGHASEMFGFVKDVFLHCAKDWGLDTFVKELDCVTKIFKGSNDFKGKELQKKAAELVSKLENKVMSPSEACNFIIRFFNNADSMSDFTASGTSLNDLIVTQASVQKDAIPIPPATSLPPKYTIYNMTSSSGRRDSMSNDLFKKDLIGDLKVEDEIRFGKLSKNDGFDSLESVVRIKEAEARMFQNKADEARREADEYKRMVCARTEKLEEEYAHKLSKLCLRETEERRRKKLEELKVLEDSHCDYLKMKRMQAEIAGLLERMEATKQQWV